jgi:hypothetical protein
MEGDAEKAHLKGNVVTWTKKKAKYTAMISKLAI